MYVSNSSLKFFKNKWDVFLHSLFVFSVFLCVKFCLLSYILPPVLAHLELRKAFTAELYFMGQGGQMVEHATESLEFGSRA